MRPLLVSQLPEGGGAEPVLVLDSQALAIPSMDGLNTHLWSWAVTLSFGLLLLCPLCSQNITKAQLFRNMSPAPRIKEEVCDPWKLIGAHKHGSYRPWAGDRSPTLDSASLERHNTTWRSKDPGDPSRTRAGFYQPSNGSEVPPPFLTTIPFVLGFHCCEEAPWPWQPS